MTTSGARGLRATELPASQEGRAGRGGRRARQAPRPARTGIAFDGVTEEWRLVGRMDIDGRLSDALNKRESIAIHDVHWAPIDGSAGLVEAPGLEASTRTT